MSDKLRKKIVLVIFFGVTIWGFYNFMPEKSENNSNLISNKTVDASINNQPNQPTNIINIEEKSKEDWGRDPFIYPKTKKTTARTKPINNKLLVLSGIIYNNSSPIAVINKKPVKIGDFIDGARVVKINKKDVILELNGSEIVLNVSKG